MPYSPISCAECCTDEIVPHYESAHDGTFRALCALCAEGGHFHHFPEDEEVISGECEECYALLCGDCTIHLDDRETGYTAMLCKRCYESYRAVIMLAEIRD